jgi:hypothetical protein
VSSQSIPFRGEVLVGEVEALGCDAASVERSLPPEEGHAKLLAAVLERGDVEPGLAIRLHPRDDGQGRWRSSGRPSDSLGWPTGDGPRETFQTFNVVSMLAPERRVSPGPEPFEQTGFGHRVDLGRRAAFTPVLGDDTLDVGIGATRVLVVPGQEAPKAGGPCHLLEIARGMTDEHDVGLESRELLYPLLELIDDGVPWDGRVPDMGPDPSRRQSEAELVRERLFVADAHPEREAVSEHQDAQGAGRLRALWPAEALRGRGQAILEVEREPVIPNVVDERLTRVEVTRLRAGDVVDLGSLGFGPQVNGDPERGGDQERGERDQPSAGLAGEVAQLSSTFQV